MTDTPEAHPTQARPATFIALSVAAWLGVVLVVQILVHREAYPVEMHELGLDYHTIHRTTIEMVREGNSPYGIPNYNTPPLCAALNAPLMFLSFETARWVWLPLVLVVTIAAYWLATRLFTFHAGGDRRTILFCGVAVIGLSYPFHFLLDRGNMDHLVMLFVILALTLAGRRDRWAGLCLALAISLKLYPALLLAPIVLMRRWRLLLWTVLAQALLTAVFPTYWHQFLTERLLVRSEHYMGIVENGGVASVFLCLGMASQKILDRAGVLVDWIEPSIRLGLCVYATLLLITIYAHLRRGVVGDRAEMAARTMLFVPFMVAIPRQVYTYELIALIMLIPAVCHLWHGTGDRTERRALALIAVGIGLGQFHAGLLARVLHSEIPHVVPAFGNLLAVAGCALYSLRTRHP